MSQTIALFHDAYREMNSKRMFWIVLVLSGVVVLAFLGINVTPGGYLTLLWFQTPFELPFSKAELFKLVFSVIGIGVWLTWVATALALISTASVFPDLISGGSIDLYLSKPISRLRLFATKYLTALLFVALQVLVFSAASFMVLGLRGGFWEPRVFLAIPLVVCLFSYLFSVCVLIGMLTRSTVAAILLTMLFWFIVFGIDKADTWSLMGLIQGQEQVRDYDPLIRQQQGSYHWLQDRLATTQPSTRESQTLEQDRQMLEKSLSERSELESGLKSLDLAHRVIYDVKTLLPKTRETNNLLDRYLFSEDEMTDLNTRGGSRNTLRRATRPPKPNRKVSPWEDPDTVREFQATMNARPISWVLGTSLLFEAVVLSLAAWVFCRRDY